MYVHVTYSLFSIYKYEWFNITETQTALLIIEDDICANIGVFVISQLYFSELSFVLLLFTQTIHWIYIFILSTAAEEIYSGFISFNKHVQMNNHLTSSAE